MSKFGYVFMISGALLTASLYAVLRYVFAGEPEAHKIVGGVLVLSTMALAGTLCVLWGARRMPINNPEGELQRARAAALRRDRVFNYGLGVIVLGLCAFCTMNSILMYFDWEVSKNVAEATMIWRARWLTLAAYLALGLSVAGGALIARQARWRVLGLQAGGAALLAGEVPCARFPVTDSAFRAHLARKYAALGVSLYLSVLLGTALVPMVTGAGLYLLIWMPGYLLLWLFRRSLFVEPYSGVALDVLLLAWPFLAVALFLGRVTFGA